MQALLFEVEPRAGHEDHYFRHAAALRPLLDAHEGLLFLDRFKSLSRPDVILSHSRWRDEAAIARWRSDGKHHGSQAAGRDLHFRDYRIRVAHVLALQRAGEAPESLTDAGTYREKTDAGTERLVVIASCDGAACDAAGGEVFASVNRPGAHLWVAEFDGLDEARGGLAAASASEHVRDALLARVTRDYGMFARAEAPQYFPPVPPRATVSEA